MLRFPPAAPSGRSRERRAAQSRMRAHRQGESVEGGEPVAAPGSWALLEFLQQGARLGLGYELGVHVVVA